MMAKQDPEGCIGGRESHQYMYNHTVCALAMTEAFGLTGSNLVKQPAQQAIDFIVNARNPERAWRYTSRCGDNDTSVTGWAIMALKSAERKNHKLRHSLLVFDEVDSVIGGQTAIEVGRKLGKLAEDNQLLVITHLHQIARESDHHYVAEKRAGKDKRATIRVYRLAGEDVDKELARMVALPE